MAKKSVSVLYSERAKRSLPSVAVSPVTVYRGRLSMSRLAAIADIFV